MMALPAGAFTEMVAAYITEQTGATFTPGMYSAMMIVNDQSDFVGGVVFSNQRGKVDIEVSCAAETPTAFRPHVCAAIFKYVFEQLGCVRCTSVTVKGNKKARAFLEGLGFVLEGNIRLGYDGRRDALIYGLLGDECPYLAGDSERDDGEKIEPDSASSAGPRSDGASSVEGEYRRGDGASEPEQDRPIHAAG